MIPSRYFGRKVNQIKLTVNKNIAKDIMYGKISLMNNKRGSNYEDKYADYLCR